MKPIRLTAFFSACAAALAAFPAALPAFADDTAPAALPEWVPTSYEEAMNFRNMHGYTYAADGVICTVFRETVPDNLPASEIEDPINAEGEGFVHLSSEIYYSPDESTKGTVKRFEVCVWQAEAAGTLSVSFMNGEEVLRSYSFASDDAKNVTETDIYSWLPDCFAEYDKYEKANGAVSTHGRYMVFAFSEGIATPTQWEEAECKGAKLCMTSYCSTVRDNSEMLVGGSNQMIYVYQCVPSEAAYTPVQIRWDCTSMGGGEPVQKISGDFIVIDAGNTALFSGETRIRLVDDDTGALIDFADYPDNSFALSVDLEYDYEGDPPDYSPIDWSLKTNPYVNHLGAMAKSAKSIEFGLDTSALPENLYLPADGCTVTKYTEDTWDVEFRLRDKNKLPTFLGDVNSDGQFDLSDIVATVKWLVSEPGAGLNNWINGDFNHDQKIDARDLTLMKRALMQAAVPPPPLEQKTAKMTVTAAYGVFSGGRFIQRSESSEEFTVKEGDIFYESEDGVWRQSAQEIEGAEKMKLVKITSVTDEGVTYINYTWGAQVLEWTTKYGEKSDTVNSTEPYIVYDGYNYSYHLTFSAE